MQNLSKSIKRTPELRMRLMDNSSHALEVCLSSFSIGPSEHRKLKELRDFIVYFVCY